MALGLHNIKHRKQTKKRLGRGNASGHGTYCGRGIKGQRARTGGKNKLKLRGFKRMLLTLPKFKGMRRRYFKAQVVYLSRLSRFEDEAQITPGLLYEKKMIADMNAPVKILLRTPEDKFDKKIEVFGCRVSASARKLIESAGGKIIELSEDDKKKIESRK
ncbi:50S ribosomal protein L15 [Candidatus Falkowbacteria bacterium]|nr:50S ribosomal protein L15 [Candidatus Falkowbacteria bacterium]